MFKGGGRCARIALAIALLTVVASCSGGSSGSPPTSTTPVVETRVTVAGPLLSSDETAEVALGRDGGITVPLPNGKDFWIFGDTPTYRLQPDKTWKLTAFIQGSSAGIIDMEPGQPPAGPVDEVVVGTPHSPDNEAAQFLASPKVYVPDGSGKECSKENAGPTAGEARWATGAALMPDQTNILVTFVDVCVIEETSYHPQGYGIALYNWKTNEFTLPPYDVIRPNPDGRSIPNTQYFGSPIITGDTVTLFSAICCRQGNAVYTTTVPTDVAKLKDPDSYHPRPVLGLLASILFNVSPPSSTVPYLTMYRLVGLEGQFQILTAERPAGPWTIRAKGTLPRCDTAPTPCNNSIYLHPELSSSSQLLVSYYLYGYGPGIPTYPDPSNQVNHIVYAHIGL